MGHARRLDRDDEDAHVVGGSPSEIRVGGVYPGLSFPAPEIGEYNYFDGGHELRLFFRHLSRDEIEAVKRGRVDFALAVVEGVIFFFYRFAGGIPWSDATFSIHLVPEDRRQIPQATGEEERALITCVIADADTGIVRAARALTLSPGFTAALHGAIREQETEAWRGQDAHDAAIRRAYGRYADTGAMMDAEEIARTKGGG